MPTRVKWNIGREGRSFTRAEIDARHQVLPEKTEVIDGRFFWTEEDRLNVLAILLENVGIDKVVRLGNPELWKAAVSELK
ncbi:MAG: hypothetical protein IAF08_13275 [Rhizobacter sp.]|nr:hypothetical protein [Chlorobiales bacterium]